MKLEKLQYQLDVIEKVLAAINHSNIIVDDNFNANSVLKVEKGIDIKMETGTGKTYVYTRLMHELKQKCGFFKFIILVPSIAIKEGAKMSIKSADWNSHFRQEFANQHIQLGIINAGDFDSKKGKRKQIPESIRSFCESTRSEEKTIQALLLNDAMLASKSMMANDYDSTLFGSLTSPIQGLRSTRPILIIDEPHRFNKENKAWKNITENLQPLLIIRLGATFPEKTTGSGKQKRTEKDYENLVYDLNAVRAFNEGLVKGVHIVYPAIPDAENTEKFRVKEIDKFGRKVIFSNTKKDIEIKLGENLSSLHEGFGGITLEYISSANSASLSNDMELYKGLDLLPNVFALGYQELLLQQALDAHFEKEKRNFYRPDINNNPPKIKTNSLFFIDSVHSFRGTINEDKGWLRIKFEELLAKKLIDEIKKSSGDYKAFLEASLNNIDGTIAGYFAEDNTRKGDEAIQEEVDDILRNKEKMLRFKNEDGSWNIRRFLFSKWALREGWDNPNVFVICKLRSSGSEISKIQEVGRGLRLPFDENGMRQSQNTNEDFRLTYIIDFSEREFAKKLVGEINADGGKLQQGKITEQLLEKLVAAHYASNCAKAKGKLLLDDIIDETDKIINTEKFFALFPEDSGIKLKNGAITSNDLPKRPTVKLNKSNFEKLRSLWNEVIKRYALHFEKAGENELRKVLSEVLQENVFIKPYLEIISQTITTTDENATLIREGFQTAASNLGELNYGEFLKRLNKRTHIPLNIIHHCIIEARKEKDTAANLFNINTLENIIDRFEEKFIALYAQKFTYAALDYTANTSIFKGKDGTIDFKEEIAQGDVGMNEISSIYDKGKERTKEKYLYDKFVYDSDIEKQVLEVEPPADVLVYGKLPRRSIKLPTYTGGTTSPDFVYAINKKNHPMQLHLIVETKSSNMRDSDKIAIESQQKAFKKIQGIEWRKTIKAEDFERDLRNLIDDYI